MQKLGYIALVFALAVTACEPKTDNDKKLAEYEKAKAELEKQKTKVHELKTELLEAGLIKENTNLSLVTTFELKPEVFENKIDIRGSVQSKGNVTLSAETPGQVTKILVKEGNWVKEGQTLIVLDGEVLRNTIAELRTSLDLAKTMFERQKALWDKNIGTEVQYLEAKNRKESLERKLATTQSQLDKTIIKAPFAGTIDMVDVRVGEIAQPGFPIIRLVSPEYMYVKADVSEAYVGKFKQGQKVDIYFPSLDKTLQSKVSAVGQVIDANNRTFELEVQIPSEDHLKPNMIAVVGIAEYTNEDALAIPTNLIFTDKNGAFVYMLKESEGKDFAIRADVNLGMTSGIKTEILSGLEAGDVVIEKGIYDISNGAQVKVVE